MINEYLKVLFLFKILFITLISSGNPADYSKKSLTIDNGLTSNKINVVYQDNDGFIWFGSINGLSRYDGINFINYEYEPHNANCLTNSNIEDIISDQSGNLYIGTNNGLNVFTKATQQFSYFPVFKNGVETGIKVNALTIDSLNNLWIGSDKGLFVYNIDKKTFNESLPEALTEEEIDLIHIDQNNYIWVGSKKNVYHFKNQDAVHISLDKQVFDDNSYNEIYCIEDVENGVWISTDLGNYWYANNTDLAYTCIVNIKSNREEIGDIKGTYLDSDNILWFATTTGIYYINRVEVKQSNNTYLFSASSYIKYFSAESIYRDNKGNVWINSSKEGILLLYPSNANFFKFHQLEFENRNSLSSNYITSVDVDKDNKLFIGTDGGGLNSFNPKTNAYKRLNTDNIDFKNVDVSVMSTLVDSRNNVWFGTYDKSLYLYNEHGELINFSDKLTQKKESGNYSITTLEENGDFIYVGTNGSGVYKINVHNFKVENLNSQNTALSNDYITSLYIDSKNQLWVGTYWGLNLVNQEADTCRSFLYDKTDSGSISNNTINSITEDFAGTIWVSTQYGLNKLNTANYNFETITKDAGLPSNVVCAIEPVSNSELWISTQKGICRMHIALGKIETLELNSPEDIIEFTPNASCRGTNGEIYFGSNNGLIQFHPDSIKNLQKSNPVVFTDIKLFNKSVYGNNSIIEQDTSSDAPFITLKHNQSMLSIEFTALNFIDSYKDEFTYFLEGFNNEWQLANKNRIATFTNLKPGKYTFQVKIQNQDDSQIATLNIRVLPPVWKTWYAFLIYTLTLILLIFIYTKYSVIRINVKNDLLIQKMQRLKDKEVTDLKMKFFTNISHEFCTPLTLIIAPLEKLRTENKNNKLYDIILKNAHRMLRLIDQLMEFRMIETDTLKLQKQNMDVVAFTREVFMAFNDLAKKNAIDYSFNSTAERYKLGFDKDKLEKILYNLISNAFKHTAHHGAIEVAVKTNQDKVDLIIKDNGAGISEENLKNIFDRFFHITDGSSGKDSPEHHSFGIGLSLTKKLVELHDGHISVSSKLKLGSAFTVTLPYMLVSDASEEQLDQHSITNQVSTQLNYDFQEITTKPSIEIDTSNTKQTVLIIDDNSDIRVFLFELLSNTYNVLEASNGKEGLVLAKKHDPDIIITDILMPVMSGIEFCKKAKKDIKTSHIPILVITALHAKEHIIEGLNSGANDYITKPFDPEVLNTKLRSILDTQTKLQVKFKKNLLFQPKEVTGGTKDDAFIKQIIEIIEENIAEDNFGVELLAQKLNITQISLYRKLKKISGLSANEFIRLIRLRKAASYVKADSELTINEIAVMVGFNDVQYFRQCFKKEFGVNPNTYKNKEK